MENINKKRIYAFITDSVLSNSIGLVILTFLNFENEKLIGEFNLLGLSINYGYSFQIFIFLFYFIFFDLINNGVTLGKLIFSIIVVNKISLKKLSFKENAKRTLYKILAICIFPVSIIVFFRNEGFTIQDKFCKTTTIKK
jgi:uncharacterized RDD family membrane protein YckC